MPLYSPPSGASGLTIDAEGFVVIPGQVPFKNIIEIDPDNGVVRTAILFKDAAAGRQRVVAERNDAS